ncbi:hypothetical protein [Roseibium suaedae]|uniref:Pentapeptide repeat-containing protein n=1 Tax=Roseibium suaedae TaxID=735517 RepID=A0A1M7PMB3_9HYPH|nr:hypothetical protein [Roseibium suaedae]SHN18436.1 hypothetical protein SAMN05444272_4514 [Roseibium suaedae]
MKQPYSIYFSYAIVGCMCLVVGGFAGGIFTIGVDAIYWGAPVAENGQTRFQMVQAIVIGVGAIITLGFAGWRTHQTHKQTETANRQAEIANRQAEVANRNAETANRQAKNAVEQTKISRSNMQIDRFQKALEMIDAAKPIQTKLAGLRILETLANEDPELLGEQVPYCFMDFVIENTNEISKAYFTSGEDFEEKIRNRKSGTATSSDVIFALNAIFRLRDSDKNIKEIKYNLSGTCISRNVITNANLSDLIFTESWHDRFSIMNCNLTDTYFNFYGSGRIGPGCDISGAFIMTSPRWSMLQCYFDPDNPPRFLGIPSEQLRIARIDPITGEKTDDPNIKNQNSPIVLPPNFSGTASDAEEYFRTALELLDWVYLEEDLATLMEIFPISPRRA